MRFLKKIVYFLILLIGIIALLASLGAYFYKNQSKQYVKTRINQFLASPVDVGEIEFSMIAKFPYASISLNDVLAWDAFPDKNGKDTLFFASKIYFEFNIIDIIQNSYTLKHIEVYKADINLRWNKKGENNFVFWKVNSKDEPMSEIELESVKFRKCRLTLDNRKVDFKSWYVVTKLDFNAHIENKKMGFNIDAVIPAFAYRSVPFNYESFQKLSLQTQMGIDQNKNTVDFKNGEFKLGSLMGKINGRVNYKNSIYDFNVNTDNQTIDNIFDALPEKYTQPLKDYRFNALVRMDLNTGNKKSKGWQTSLDFKTLKGEIHHLPSGISIDKLELNGNFIARKSNLTLQLDSYKGEFSGSPFNGKLSIKNFNHPLVNLHLNGAIDLERLLGFLDIKSIEKPYGTAQVTFDFNGRFNNPKKITPSEIERAITIGKLSLNNVGFKVPKLNMEFDGLNGELILNDNDATITRLTGVWKGAKSSVTGQIHNLIPFILFPDLVLHIKASGEFDKINLEEFLTSTDENEKSQSFKIPCFLDLNIRAMIHKFNYKKFEADNFSGLFYVNNCRLTSDDFYFNTANGKVRGDFQLSNSGDEKMNLVVNTTLMNIDIDKLFYEFDDFGQKIIKSNQIKGKLNAALDFKGTWDKKLNFESENMDVDAIISIENGELNKLKSLTDISNYLKSNTLTKTFIDTRNLETKLEHIKFKSLSNRIKIIKGVIEIPEMSVLSSALDLTVSGTHDFNNNINYRMNFRLQQLKSHKKDTEFGIVEDDGSGIRVFLKIEGTTENPIFSLDKETKKKWRKNTWQKESEDINKMVKNELKTIFKAEKNSNTFKEEGAKKVEIEWDENPDSTKTIVKKDTLKSKTKTRIFQAEEDDIRNTDDDDY